jgi:hypothetical protein
MHWRKRSDGRKVFDSNVPGESGPVHKQIIASNLAVVADVSVRQEKILVADSRHAPAFICSAADGHVFAKNIFVSRNELSSLSRKRVVLRITANHAKRMKHVRTAQP